MNVPILAWHRVGPLDGSLGDQFTVSPDVFAQQLELMRAQGFVGIDLDTFIRRERPRQGRPVVLTFDDGFASNIRYAWPALDAAGFRATTFIVADRLGGSNDWDGPSVPRYPLVEAADCTATAAPMMTFHPHGATHRRLPQVDAATLALELSTSRRKLMEVTGTPGDLFAYPFGSVTTSVAHAVRAAGYRAACTCIGGLNTGRSNPFLLRRALVTNEDVAGALVDLLRVGRKPTSFTHTLRERARERIIGFGLRTGTLTRHRAGARI